MKDFRVWIVSCPYYIRHLTDKQNLNPRVFDSKLMFFPMYILLIA